MERPALLPLFGDFETYFGEAKKADGSRLSLSLRNPKLSMTEYVRHPESEVLGVSLWFDAMKQPEFFRQHELRGVFKDIDWSRYRFIAHNALFEALIMWEWFRIVPGGYFCTMALSEAIFQGQMARGLDYLARELSLGEKLPDLADFKNLHARDLGEEQWLTLGRYANNDVWLAALLFQKLAPLLPEKEWELMSRTLMMFGRPLLKVDVPLAREALAEAQEERRVALVNTGLVDQHGKPFADYVDKRGRAVTALEQIEDQISGNISFAAHLGAALGGPIPMKPSPKHPEKLIPAFSKTDAGFIALKTHPSEKVRNLVEARLMVKGTLPITRAQRLIDIGTTGSTDLNVCLHYSRAHTMRWSGGNKMNLQNLKRGSKLRRAIVAPPGHVILVVDSSQIEPRWLNTGVGQQDIIDIFLKKGDPYSYQASKAYGFTVTKKTHPIERQVGKVMQLSLGYQTGAAKLYTTLNIKEGIPVSFEFCQRLVKTFRTENDKVSGHWAMWDKEWLPHLVFGTKRLEILDGLMTLDPLDHRIIFPNGCYLRYPGLECDEGQYRYWVMKGEKRREWKYVYGGAMTENWVQAISRHTVAEQLLPISDLWPVVLMSHDEGAFVVPEAQADEALAFALAEFRRRPSWAPENLPLDAEGGYDVCYSK